MAEPEEAAAMAEPEQAAPAPAPPEASTEPDGEAKDGVPAIAAAAAAAAAAAEPTTVAAGKEGDQAGGRLTVEKVQAVVDRLRAVGCSSTQGVFRVPGDALAIKELAAALARGDFAAVVRGPGLLL